MNATENSRRPRRSKTRIQRAVRKLLVAVDRAILAARDAERARDELARAMEGNQK